MIDLSPREETNNLGKLIAIGWHTDQARQTIAIYFFAHDLLRLFLFLFRWGGR